MPYLVAGTLQRRHDRLWREEGGVVFDHDEAGRKIEPNVQHSWQGEGSVDTDRAPDASVEARDGQLHPGRVASGAGRSLEEHREPKGGRQEKRTQDSRSPGGSGGASHPTEYGEVRPAVTS